MTTSPHIEAIDPLTPMQEGILFHTLLDPRGAYLQQLRCRIEGPLDRVAFERAWQSVVDRHPALRSIFVWEHVRQPVQVVMADCAISIGVSDAYPGPPEPIPLDRAPLMRFNLVRLDDATHDLLWTHSHLLLDGWSTAIVFAEVREAYAALVEGRAPRLNDPPPYRDYLAWLQRQNLAAAERFWRRELAGFGAATPLVLERKIDVPAEWREHRIRIDASRLSAFARPEHLTINSVLAGAWALLLARTAEENDVVIGTTVAGRPAELPDIESMVGLFINTIPLRLSVPLQTPAGEWLRSVQESLAAAREFEFAPLPRIHEWSDVSRGTPLFESLFVFENYPLSADPTSSYGGVRITDVALPERTNYPMTVIAEPHGDVIEVRFVYDTRRFDDGAAARYASMYRVLVDALAADVPLHAIPLMSAQERETIVHAWNDTAAPYDREVCIHELFERQAARTPDAVAVTDGRRSITYAELADWSSELALALREHGVVRGSFVGIKLPRGIEMVPALLAVLKLGAAYVPVEPCWPSARIAEIFDSLDVREVIDRVPPWSGRRCAETSSDRGASADDIAYVIFTSGSSGKPKGVVVRHRPVINLIEWVNDTFAMSASDRVLFITSLCFDLSVYDVFGLLACGGSIRVASDDEVRDPEALVAALANEPITFWDSAPAALLQCVPFFPPRAERALRLVFLSGDWVPLRLREDVIASFPAADVIALGGATEATVWSNWYRIGEIDPRWVSIPYGKPIRNARYYVLDPRLEPLPPGAPGDLYIGGEVLCDGYARSPELTAQKFIADPFTGGRLYRTGDRARFFEDGNIEFLGRLDQQVKIRGFRIELGEIEAALRAHPAVHEPIVIARGDGMDRRLIAYVIGEAAGADELRAHLAQRLPAHMIPSAFVFVDAFPVTANGKLDRKALPAPEEAPVASESSPDPVAALIAQIWCDVLGVESIEHDRDFFTAGGHSLLAVRLIARLRDAFGLDVPLRIVFDEPTVERQVAAIRTVLRTRAGASASPIARVPRDAPLAPSFAQTRLWFLQQLDPASAFYNVPIAAKLSGVLDRDALRRAIDEIVRRHEVLRGRFLSGDEGPLHVIDDIAAVPFEEIDARGENVDALIAEAAKRPFDLARDRLIRATLFRTGDDEHALLVVIHHIASDGWSMALLVRELEALYRAFVEGTPSPLRALPLQYADYAAWQREALAPERLAMLLEWWTRRLSGAVATELAGDRPRPAVQSFRGRRHAFTLTPELSSALRALARREGATLFMTIAAAFQLLLSYETGCDDVVIGTDVANRNDSETAGLIGFFVNQLVLRTSIAGSTSFSALLRRMRTACVDAYAHQDVPFERVVQAVNPPRDASRMPLFQIKLVLQDTPPAVLDLPSLRVTPLTVETDTAKYDLLLTIENTPALEGTIEYATDLYDAPRIARLADRWRTLLEQCALAPDRSPSELRAAVDAASSSLAGEQERLRREEGLRKLRNVRRTMITGVEP